MGSFTTNVPCVGCGACCGRMLVTEVCPGHSEVDDMVPKDMIEQVDGFFIMKKNPQTLVCVAFDEEKKCCTIYDRRPETCRDFEPGCQMCLNTVQSCKDGESRKRILKSLAKLNKEKKQQEARKMLMEMKIVV